MLRVLRQRDFSLLWFAGLVSFTGDWMLAVALPLTVYQITGSPLATGGILISNKIAATLLGTIAGVFVDRWDRKRTMVIANLIRAPLLLPLLAVDSADRVWIVYVMAASLSAVGQFFRPAERALLPRLVGEEDLVPANSLNSLNDNLSKLAGPALGGVTAAWIGLNGVAIADAGTYLVAALMIAAIATATMPARPSTPNSHNVADTLSAVRRDWVAGLRLIRDSRVLRLVFGVFAVASLAEGVYQTAFWVYVDRTLHGGTREAGWLLSAQAVGGLLGALIVGSRGKLRPPIVLFGWGGIGMGITDLVVFNYPRFVSGIWLGMIFMALGGVTAAAFGAGYTAAIQIEVDDAYRGRVFGALLASSALLMIFGAAIAGLTTARLGPVAVLTIDSFGYAAGGVIALRTFATIPFEKRKADWA